jgi:hypothetical protein
VTVTHNANVQDVNQFLCQLRKLEEGEKYTVRARARNEKGWGSWSKKSGMLPTAKVSGFRKDKEALSAVPDSPTPGGACRGRHTPRNDHATCHVITPQVTSRHMLRRVALHCKPLPPGSPVSPTNKQPTKPTSRFAVRLCCRVSVYLPACLSVCLSVCLCVRFFFVLCACCCHLLWLPPTQQCTAKSTHHQASPACFRFRFRFVCRLPFALRSVTCHALPCPACHLSMT